MLEIKNIKKKFETFRIEDISLNLETGDYLVILGKSGAGKTLLLEMIMGLVKPDSGKVFSDGEDITCRKIQARKIGIVFQNNILFPHMTVSKNISYALGSSRQFGKTKIRKKVISIAERFGIKHLLKCYPGTLSAGEAQRAALARTLIAGPEYLLLDEPLSSLDPQTRTEIRYILKNILSDVNNENSSPVKGIIHVTHDYEDAIALATKVAVINSGCIEQSGTPEEIFLHPKSEFTAGFVGIKNFYEGEVRIEPSGRHVFHLAGVSGGPVQFVVPEQYVCGKGYTIIKSEDVTISNLRTETSARNVFAATVTDIEKTRQGMEILMAIGVKISALITAEAMEELEISIGKKVFISFKASSVRFLKM